MFQGFIRSLPSRFLSPRVFSVFRMLKAEYVHAWNSELIGPSGIDVFSSFLARRLCRMHMTSGRVVRTTHFIVSNRCNQGETGLTWWYDIISLVATFEVLTSVPRSSVSR